jgi:hypothetical protein
LKTLPAHKHLLRHFSVARGTLIGAAIAICALPLLQAEAQVVGVNSAIRNKVEIRPSGAQAPKPAVLKQRVSLNDEIRTGAQSQLRVLLLDSSEFSVGSSARVVIDRFVYDPAKSTRTMGASVAKGSFRFMSGRSTGIKSSNSRIQTPVGSIGIRGTIVEGAVGEDAMRIAAGESAIGPGVISDPETATLVVLRGPGARAEGNSAAGAIDIQAGEFSVSLSSPTMAVYIPRAGAKPIGPFKVSMAGLAQLQQLLVPSLMGPASFANSADPMNAPQSATVPAERAQTDPSINTVAQGANSSGLILGILGAAAAIGGQIIGLDSNDQPVSI